MDPKICSTGTAGLDHVLSGGLPRHRLYIVQGNAGVGKTTLGLKFLLAGRDAGERCLYISLSETKSELDIVAESHGWSLKGIEIMDASRLESQLQKSSTNTLFHPSDVELNQTVDLICNEVDRLKPDRVVLDSLSEIRLMADQAHRYRRQIIALKQFFAARGTTVILNENTDDDTLDLQMKSVAHGVIALEVVPNKFGADRRRLRVVKLRGLQYRSGEHDYVIEPGGLSVFPRLVAADHVKQFDSGLASSGITGLDEMLGGGLARGTSTLFLGPAGANKTTLATQFASTAAGRGEKVSYYTFDETTRSVIEHADSLGIDMQKHVDSSHLNVHQIDPAELTPGEMAARIREKPVEPQELLATIATVAGRTGHNKPN